MNSRTSATTWLERLLRASYMVSTMPWIDELGIERRLHLLDGLQQLRQAFEREELALQRHQDRVRRRHRVDGEQVERRRTIDQHIGEVAGAGELAGVERRERVAQPEGAVARLADFELEAGEIERRRRDRKPRHRGRRRRRRAASLRRSARRRSRRGGCGGRCRARSRRCPADRDR